MKRREIYKKNLTTNIFNLYKKERRKNKNEVRNC